MKKNKNAFTLMELIIVVAVLAIVGAIGFMSFDGYLKDSRNTTRNVDLNTIKNGIEFYHQKNLVYPTPDSYINISYSGSNVWKQGYFPNDIDGFDDSSHLFLDPTTGSGYSYSLLSSGKEFEVAAALEPVQFITNNNKTYAASSDPFLLGKALVLGNYNGKLLKTKSGSEDHILALPSIISSIKDTNLLNIISNKKLVYNVYHNMPFTYEGSDFIVEGGFDFVPNLIVVFSGSLVTLRTDELQRYIFYKNFQLSYEGTLLSRDDKFSDLVASENIIDPFNPTSEDKELVKHLFEKTLRIKTYKIRN